MKKLLLLLSLFITIAVAMVYAQSVTVTSPNGGENWTVGSSHDITWNRSGEMSDNVKIRLMRGHGGLEDLVLKITDSAPNNGTFGWRIPNSLAPGNYLIRIKTVDDAVGDDGELFTISSAPTITVTSPDGGESWNSGQSYNITWDRSGEMSDNVKIRLMRGHGGMEDLVLKITDSAPNNGTFGWQIPNSLASGDYLIRIKTVDDAVGDDGELFSINSSAPTIKVTSPTSMWSFNAGGKMTVKWRTSGITGNVMITLHDKDGNQVFLVKSSHPYNKSPYRFSIPDNLGTGKYHIIISQGNIFGKSGNFSINKKTHTIQISHPARNATYLKGKVCTIKWHSHNIPDNFVNIWLKHVSSGSLKPLFSIAKKTANKEGRNNYSWKISRNIKEGDYQVYIEDTSRKYSGMSGKFKILASRKCDLALVDVKYCGKDIVATIKNLGDHYVGKIVLNLQMPHLKPTPLFKTFPAKDIALFRNKSITIKYRKPYYTQIKYRANFMLNLSTDKEHTDLNPKNNLFAGRVYGGCKPDLSVRALHSGKSGPSKVGDNLKLRCQIENMGGEVKTPWVLRLEIKTRAGVVVRVKEWTFRMFDMATKHEYKYKIPKNVFKGGYNTATWCVDFYNRIDEEKENNQCASLGFMVK